MERDGVGNSDEVDNLTASDGVADDRLGFSVAVDGDIAILGAISHDLTPGGNEGAAYIYECNGSGTWVETKLVEPDTDPATVTASFGRSVVVSGDTAIVSASGNGEGGLNAGAAYIFERDSFGNWSSLELTIATLEFSDDFGSAVAISGDFAVVGAGGAASEADNSSDEAYIFERDGNRNWVEASVLFGANLFGTAKFGASVAIDGNLAVVGA